MDFRKNGPGSDGFATPVAQVPDANAPAVATGLPPRVSEALADPIVKAMMVADRVDPKGIEELLRRIAGGLARHDREPSSPRARSTLGSSPGTTFARLAKGLAVVLALIAGLLAGPGPAAADDPPTAFVRALGAQAVSVIRSPMPLTGKMAYFQQMVRQDFDLSSMCRFVLGRYWRVANPLERHEFCDGFADRIVRFYGRQLADAGDGDFVVTGSRTGPDSVVVTSRIIRPQRPPIAVDWRLGVSDGFYKIEDVAIDGVSMALAQRSEISAQIARDGGQLRVLLATMRG
jgi:phospholipid transport system substrate-binding protein